MKTMIIHSIPAIISFIWLIINKDTFNPISLKGPDFLTFYLIFLFGFYASVLLLKSFREHISKRTLYFMIFIVVLGLIKLIRGVYLGKPVGFLIIILITECIVMMSINVSRLNHKIK